MPDPKFLYLTHPEWVQTWVDGGQVPLNLASSYLSEKRHATLTPDEAEQRELRGISYPDFKQGIHIKPGANISVSDVRIRFPDGRIAGGPEVLFTQRQEDGLILCLSNSFSKETMLRFGKTACVEIPDCYLLLNSIDKQLKTEGRAGKVEYTDSLDRNHFLKSKEDQWQDEFRLFWPLLKPEEVRIHAGLASLKHAGIQNFPVSDK